LIVHIFNYSFLKTMKVDPDILSRAANIENLNGRTAECFRGLGSVAAALESNAIIMSVRDSNAIEGIGTTADRMIGLVGGSIIPHGHDEAEIVGYSEALRYIHRNHSSISIDKQSILGIYAILMSRSERNDIGFKTRDNAIVDRAPDGTITAVYPTVPADETEGCMDQLIWAFWEARNDLDINKLLLIPCFIMDFLRIHPFLDGNGRMSRLLTTLLLYQEGYDVCRYVSMESKINSSKMDYYRALEESQVGWMENRCDYGPFIHYFLGELFLCYRELNRLTGEELGRRRRSEGLEAFLRLTSVPVGKSELMSMFPEVSQKTVERTLRRMCDAGDIVMIGSGRSTRYISKRSPVKGPHNRRQSSSTPSRMGHAMKLGESVRNAIVAVVIGIFMMMPGVSGATLAVIFGIYDRLIRDISQPRKYLREDAWFLLTIIVVGLIGAFICLKFLAFLLDDYEVPLMFFFATAVAIQLPDLWRQAGGGGKPTSYNMLALAIGFILMIIVLYAYVTSGGWEAPSNPIILIAAGVIYGACLLSPGISGSTVLLALGLFTVVVDGLADLDLMAIAPLIAGAAVGILLFAKVIDHFITHNRSSTYFAIIGLTAGSVVTVIVQAILKMEEGDSILLCVLAIAAGIALGVVTHLFTSKYTVPHASERYRSQYQEQDHADRRYGRERDLDSPAGLLYPEPGDEENSQGGHADVEQDRGPEAVDVLGDQPQEREH